MPACMERKSGALWYLTAACASQQSPVPGAPRGLLRRRERVLQETCSEQCLVVATEAADDLHAERHAAVIVEPGDIDAGRAQQGPQPVEDRRPGGVWAGRGTRRRR